MNSKDPDELIMFREGNDELIKSAAIEFANVMRQRAFDHYGTHRDADHWIWRAHYAAYMEGYQAAFTSGYIVGRQIEKERVDQWVENEARKIANENIDIARKIL